MKQFLKFSPELVLGCYILLFLFFKNPGVPWDRSINSDGKGYYAYLPAIFIYHDLSYKFVESYEAKYYPADRSAFKEFRIQENGKTVNKCFPGLAILWLPFFLIAHLLSYLLGFPADGYSLLYQYAISIAALFYLWLGCRFLMNLMRRSGAGISTAAFITFIVALGTNIVYFTIVEDSMSHVYSFALISLFLFTVFLFFQDKKGKHLILSAILYGLIVIVRPPNGLILLLIPLMAWLANPAIKNFISSILHPPATVRTITTGVLVLLLILAVPLLLWHHTTGHWLVYQYGEERYHFLHPHFLGILLSYNRGWFVYTPVAFVSIFGFAGLANRNKQVFLWTLTFLLVFIYTSSCWWMWYYASKCGQRIFIDLYPFVGLLLYFLYRSVQKVNIVRYLLTLVLVVFAGLNLFQCYQHSCFVFPATDLTKEIYWDSFSRLHPVAKVYLPKEAILLRKSVFTDMEKPEGWENQNTLRSPFGTSGKYSSLITRKHPYSVARVEKLPPIFLTLNRVVRVSAMVWSCDSATGSTLVMEIRLGEEKLSYNSFYLHRFVQADRWTPVEAAFYVPRDIPENSVAKVYFFNNKGSVPLFVDDINIEFISLKDEQQYTMMEGIQSPVR